MEISITEFNTTVARAATLIRYILILIDFSCLSYAGHYFGAAMATVSVGCTAGGSQDDE